MSIADFLGVVALPQGALAFDLSPGRPTRRDTGRTASYCKQIDLIDRRGATRAVLGDSPKDTFLTIMARPSATFEVEVTGKVKRLRLRAQDLTLTLEIADKKRILVDRPLRRKYAVLAVDDGERLSYLGLVQVVLSI